MIKVFALKETVQSGGISFPVYVSLMPASTVAAVSYVPRFGAQTKNNEIARNVSAKPVKEWQRPEITEKVAEITMLYDNSGKFMPNPVLLGENVSASTPPIVSQFLVGGFDTPVWEITINDDQSQPEKPLWILDGQHRIAGLAKSAQSSNAIPVVLLLNQGGTYYQPNTLAEIFAEVTTSATPLGDLHKEWLSYAFDLNEYSDRNANATGQHKSMETVIELCKNPTFGAMANPYFDRIRFNDRASLIKPATGGHPYDCKELTKNIFASYYCAAKTVLQLAPIDVAAQMCLARKALETVTAATPQPRSVFFGDEEHHQKIMEDAFWHGVLTYLCYHSPPPSWSDVLRTLKFDQTSWDFSWKKTLHGRSQTRSSRLAQRVFGNAFRTVALPSGSNSLSDFLRGNGAGFRIEAFRTTVANKIDKKSETNLDVKKGDSVSFSIDDRKVVRIAKNYTDNIAEIEVTDKRAPPGTLVPYGGKVLSSSGLSLDPAIHKKPLELLITMHHYGGVLSTADLDVIWT